MWAPRLTLALCVALSLPGMPEARADVFSATNYSNVLSLITETNAGLFMSAVGSWSAYREFDGATVPTTPVGFDAGIEVTLTKLPGELAQALTTAGTASASTLENGLPIARLHVRKRLGSKLNLGLVGIAYGSYRSIGGGLKLNLSTPEEGVAWAIRLGYVYTHVGFVVANTYTPEVVISKALEFAEPYLSLGAILTNGSLTLENVAVNGIPVTLQAQGGSAAITGTLGLSLRLAQVLQIALEGGYHSQGAPHLGARIGIGF